MYKKDYKHQVPLRRRIYMCMACDTKGKITRKRVIVLSSAASGIAVATHLISTLTHNLAIAATLPAVLSLAACPAMCIGMGGVLWFVNRLSGKNKNKNQAQILNPKRRKKLLRDESCSCGNGHNPIPNQKLQYSKSENKNKDDIDTLSYNMQAQKNKFKN